MSNRKVILTSPFEKTFVRLPKEIREATYQKIELLLENSSHPSLRVKKIKGTHSIWEMSITMNYRITFEVGKKEILLRKIGTHDVLRNP